MELFGYSFLERQHGSCNFERNRYSRTLFFVIKIAGIIFPLGFAKPVAPSIFIVVTNLVGVGMRVSIKIIHPLCWCLFASISVCDTIECMSLVVISPRDSVSTMVSDLYSSGSESTCIIMYDRTPSPSFLLMNHNIS